MKKRLNDKKSSNGFSLLEVMIAGALATIVIAGMTSSIFYMMKAQKSIALSSEWNQFSSQIDLTLKNQVTCAQALSGKAFNTALDSNDGTALTLNGIRINGPTPVNVSHPYPITTGLTLTKLVMHAANNDNFPTSIEMPVGSGTFVPHELRKLAVTMQADRDRKISVGGLLKPVVVVIPVLVRTSTGTISECQGAGDEDLLRSACEQMGGTYVLSNPPTQRCKPSKFCKIGGSYSNGYIANPFTGGYSCPGPAQGFEAGYTAFHTGKITITTVGPPCSKYGCTTRTNYYESYQCMKCN